MWSLNVVHSACVPTCTSLTSVISEGEAKTKSMWYGDRVVTILHDTQTLLRILPHPFERPRWCSAEHVAHGADLVTLGKHQDVGRESRDESVLPVEGAFAIPGSESQAALFGATSRRAGGSASRCWLTARGGRDTAGRATKRVQVRGADEAGSGHRHAAKTRRANDTRAPCHLPARRPRREIPTDAA